jgi:hypothetical protein
MHNRKENMIMEQKTRKDITADYEPKAFRCFLWGALLSILPFPVISIFTMLAGRVMLYWGAGKLAVDSHCFRRMKQFMLVSIVVTIVYYVGICGFQLAGVQLSAGEDGAFATGTLIASIFGMVCETINYIGFAGGLVYMGYGFVEKLAKYGKQGGNRVLLPALCFACTLPLEYMLDLTGISSAAAVNMVFNVIWLGAALWLLVVIYYELRDIETAKEARMKVERRKK